MTALKPEAARNGLPSAVSFATTRSTGFTAAQLYSTASYQNHDLTGINFVANNMPGWNFVGQNLTDANFRIANLAGADDTVAVVFGREESGLSAADIAACQRTAVIPTWPEFPTMNLAQSVAIFCYELRKGLRPPLPPREAAPMHLVQHLNAEARALLEEAGFFGAMSADRICAELQALEGRVMLTTREASLLLGLVRKLGGRR